MIYLDLLYITLFVALIEDTGFWDNLDEEINRRFKLYHLPHLFRCSLCQTWWLCLLYIIVTNNLTFFNIIVCLLLANLPPFIIALFNSIKGIIWKLINILNNKIVK
jgi:hypothetical protein